MLKNYLAYLKDNPKGYWFKARWFGWGWTPVTWQGWLTIFLYTAILLKIAVDAEAGFVVSFVVLTAIFVALLIWKGEKPRWSWGDPRKK
ncbi:MAG: hypothetical protein COU68_04280 [Candidatus Pacebacteria bacterium CG10_big_fil_rev_8_21_14_0_10_45_6]|nr:MAG: hypothetical protein COU68_04280 [Candidatus Pacebacteria bacterium CG10_big_fil_rev_8_21_14_0_10_45_6]